MADTETISRIREYKNDIRKTLKTINLADHKNESFGTENEYVAKGVIAGIESILIDISVLLKAPAQFLKISTHSERSLIYRHLKELSTHLTNDNIEYSANSLDSLLPLLRVYQVRSTDERFEELNTKADDLLKKSITVEREIHKLEELRTQALEENTRLGELASSLQDSIDSADSKIQTLEETISQLERKKDELEGIVTDEMEKSAQIQVYVEESKSHTELVDSFSKKISTREAQLEDQETKTNTYNDSLKEYSIEQDKILSEANDLIKKSRQALEYSTAEGLSAAFSEKYREAKEDPSTWLWLVGSGVFVSAVIGLGVWTLNIDNLSIFDVVVRIALLPVLIGATWFCAGQHVRNKNIAEDYAYKSVLAKSLVGFSDQLSSDSEKGNEYSSYIASVMAEIHQDPLRKHHVAKANDSNSIPSADDIYREIGDLKNKLAELLSKKSV